MNELYAITQSVMFPDWYFAKEAAKLDRNEDLISLKIFGTHSSTCPSQFTILSNESESPSSLMIP